MITVSPLYFVALMVSAIVIAFVMKKSSTNIAVGWVAIFSFVAIFIDIIPGSNFVKSVAEMGWISPTRYIFYVGQPDFCKWCYAILPLAFAFLLGVWMLFDREVPSLRLWKMLTGGCLVVSVVWAICVAELIPVYAAFGHYAWDLMRYPVLPLTVCAGFQLVAFALLVVSDIAVKDVGSARYSVGLLLLMLGWYVSTFVDYAYWLSEYRIRFIAMFVVRPLLFWGMAIAYCHCVARRISKRGIAGGANLASNEVRKNVKERLGSLDELHAEGVVSDDEYAQQRKRILESV